MSSRPGDSASAASSSKSAAEELIEDYLDYLCAPLIGVVPYRQRQDLRAEARQHILEIVAELEADGITPSEAVPRAIRAHGNPWAIGQSFVQEWSRSSDGSHHHAIRWATLCAFVWFGIATVVSQLLVERYVATAGAYLEQSPTRGYLMPVAHRATLLPYLLGTVAASPILAGCLTGLMAPRRVLRGVVNALAILCGESLVTALVLLPSSAGLLFVLAQVAIWLPLGCSAAVAAATARQYRLYQRFWSLSQ